MVIINDQISLQASLPLFVEIMGPPEYDVREHAFLIKIHGKGDTVILMGAQLHDQVATLLQVDQLPVLLTLHRLLHRLDVKCRRSSPAAATIDSIHFKAFKVTRAADQRNQFAGEIREASCDVDCKISLVAKLGKPVVKLAFGLTFSPEDTYNI